MTTPRGGDGCLEDIICCFYRLDNYGDTDIMNQNLAFTQQNTVITKEAQPVVIEGSVFNSDFILPEGSWNLHITEGDAWIFSNNDDFLLHTNENIVISNIKGTTRIKRLYTTGKVEFVAYPC